jgi:hypothetical protein
LRLEELRRELIQIHTFAKDQQHVAILIQSYCRSIHCHTRPVNKLSADFAIFDQHRSRLDCIGTFVETRRLRFFVDRDNLSVPAPVCAEHAAPKRRLQVRFFSTILYDESGWYWI